MSAPTTPPAKRRAIPPFEVGREAAESDARQLRRLQRAEALLLDVWDAWHREGHEQSETIDAAIDRLGDWRWNEGYDPSNPPLRPDPRKARAARRGGQKGEGR